MTKLSELTKHPAFQALAQLPEGDLEAPVRALSMTPPEDLKPEGEAAEKYNRLMHELSDLTGASTSLSVSSSKK